MEVDITLTNECVFRNILDTCNIDKKYGSKELSATQNSTIQRCSQDRNDGFHDIISDYDKWIYHTDCYCAYTSREKIARYLKRRKEGEGSNTLGSPTGKRLRSSVQIFDFKRACFICGEACAIQPDKKHPARWKKNPGILCRTADRGKNKDGNKRKGFKEVLQQVCETRDDDLGETVRIRLEGASTDLHAADARYHKNCYRDFVNKRLIKARHNQYDKSNPDEDAINFVIRSIKNEPERTWTSTELHDKYIEKGGAESHISRFINVINKHMEGELYCFKAYGLASIIMHREKASKMFKIVKERDDEEDIELKIVAEKIKTEIKKAPSITNNYPVLSEDTLSEISLPTLENLLALISPKLANSKMTALMSSMVTSTATSSITMLQVALGLLIQEKRLIEHLYEYRVTASYDEIRRFKISAAAASTSSDTSKTLKQNSGLIQGVSDNFDANLSTQNGLKQTHSLATIITQYCNSAETERRQPIPRLKKSELSTVELQDIKIQTYTGEKKPSMPKSHSTVGVLPLKVLCQQTIMVMRSKEDDFCFIKSSLEDKDAPDYSGYNTKIARVAGQSMKPKTSIMYRPLINKTPSDPSTMLTAMTDVELVTTNAGQEVSVFTCDQQLYRVTLDIVWANPERWKSFYPRLGGMHWVMSFAGCIGKLMANSGLEKVMSCAFAGVPKMLIGKKFPMNIRALRFVVLELLRGFVEDMVEYEDLIMFLNNVAGKSRLADHWVNNLIKPVLLIMLFIRAEREGEFALHLYACKQMLPYFFAAGHWNYARDGVAYVRMMENLPNSLLDPFMKGQHVIHLSKGLWNGIWTDMGIETTYMKIGKGPAGLIGVTTNTRSVQIWANGHHLCSELSTELEGLRNNGDSQTERKGKTHKEEGKGRIQSDAEDKRKLQLALSNCIHPFETESHIPAKLVNIYTGEEASDNVNVDKSIEIGKQQFFQFQNSLPEGFREKLSSKVTTMAEGKKNKKNVPKESFNTELIFSRVLYLLGIDQLDFTNLFNYELAPVPTSLFKDTGEPRFTSSKSTLKNKLKVDVSSRGIVNDAILVDGGGMLHSSIHWPKEGLVEDFVKGIEQYITKTIVSSDGYLVFDRYFDYSIKSETRLKRIGLFKRTHNLSIKTTLPAKEICMSSTQTKENLIQIIADQLLQRFAQKKVHHKLIVTSKNTCPVETRQGMSQTRFDLESKFDEADYILPQQVDSAVKEGKKSIKVISSDTDVFVLLCSMYLSRDWSNAEVYIQDFNDDKNLISVKRTVEKHKDLIPFLIAVHSISGCDTVPMMFGIGKVKALSALEKCPLQLLGQENADISEVIIEAKQFVAQCYGMKETSSSKNRLSLWTRKTDSAKLTAKPPALRSLPPTDPALELNIKRAHYQAMMWHKSVDGCLPSKDPCEFGWEKETETKTLKPTMLPPGVEVAPEEVLKSTRCNCSTSQCKTLACSCNKARIPCTEFCGCSDHSCTNKWNISIEDEDDGESNDEM